MSDGTKIEWTEATWNPITGCSVTSPGCTNCYAMKLAGTRLAHHESRAGLTIDTKAGPVWTGEVRFNEQWLDQPLRWRRPRIIFVCAHGDLFHESVSDEWIDRVFAVMALCPQHTFQVLTKRSSRMREYLTARKAAKPVMVPIGDGTLEQHPFNSQLQPPPNIWLGVSVEDQARADERIPDLLATPAAVRWLSCEPLLGPVDLTSIDIDGESCMDALNSQSWSDEFERWRDSSETWQEDFLDWYSLPGLPGGKMHPTLGWIVAGGESGPGARGSTDEVEPWMRSLRDQCAAAGVSFFGKQNFRKLPLPSDLIVREYPHAAR